MLKNYIIGIPTYTRYDLLNHTINCFLQYNPKHIYVINNGYKPFTYEDDRVTVVKTQFNLGVARSWATLMSLAWPYDCILSNDDITFPEETLREILLHPTKITISNEGFSLFKLQQEVYKKVGDFDRELYPAYYEDGDYFIRCLLNDIPVGKSYSPTTHYRSSTIASYSAEEREAFNNMFNDNTNYYKQKWGGLPNSETVTMQPLTARYLHCCSRNTDINEHLPVLAALAGECNKVIEFGAREGNSTTALLFARPKQLKTVDLIITDKLRELISMTPTDVRFTIQQGDTLTIDAEECDMLFIDTYHSGEHVYKELCKHGKYVNKYIVFHDTVIFGDVAEDGCSKGLMYGINKWLAENDKYKIHMHLQNNNGLLIVKKV